MDHASYIVDRLEASRRDRGIPVAALARRVGVDRKRLWCVLHKKRGLRADELVRLAGVLGMALADFVPPQMAARLEAERRKVVEEFGAGLAG